MSVPDAENVFSICITNREKLLTLRDEFKPTHVIHCAGVCDLDVCEERPEWAYLMNVDGSRIIAEVFGRSVPVFYMSSDLVFSGIEPPLGGYSEGHQTDPVSVVGKTFIEAEKYIQTCENHCIFRIGLPLGDSVTGDKGAVDWIESRFKRNLPVTLFYDEYRSCISCEEIGEMVIKSLILKLKGLFHFGGDKSWSLHDIGKYVLTRGEYSQQLLTGMMRMDEKNGPPRVNDVSLNSNKLKKRIAI